MKEQIKCDHTERTFSNICHLLDHVINRTKIIMCNGKYKSARLNSVVYHPTILPFTMLLILLLFGSFHLLQGSPTTNTQPTAPVLLADNISIPQDALSLQFGSRTTFDIIKSCLLTIVACTWTAIHPNIPSPTDTRWIILKRRIVTALCALVAPEAITLWALRQRFAAGRIARDYNDFLIKSLYLTYLSH